MEIRSIKVDFDKDILEINGKKVEKSVIVTLPGPDEWPIQKLFNPESYIPESVKQLKVIVSGSEEAAKKDEISKIFSQRMRGFNAHPNDLPVITAVIEAMRDCTIEQAEAILDDALKIIKTMTRIR